MGLARGFRETGNGPQSCPIFGPVGAGHTAPWAPSCLCHGGLFFFLRPCGLCPAPLPDPELEGGARPGSLASSGGSGWALVHLSVHISFLRLRGPPRGPKPTGVSSKTTLASTWSLRPGQLMGSHTTEAISECGHAVRGPAQPCWPDGDPGRGRLGPACAQAP